MVNANLYTVKRTLLNSKDPDQPLSITVFATCTGLRVARQIAVIILTSEGYNNNPFLVYDINAHYRMEIW